MSLQTGTKLAQTSLALIDPENLKVIAYEVEGSMLAEKPSFIRIADVRELSSVGMIIDSSDEFIGVEDVIRIKELYRLGFKLIDMGVTEETGHKLGKVEDYVLDNASFVIKQLSVKRGIMKSLGETSLLIDRSQIVEINDKNIIVKSGRKDEPITEAEKQEFVNPFRAPTVQTDNRELSPR